MQKKWCGGGYNQKMQVLKAFTNKDLITYIRENRAGNKEKMQL